MTLGTTRLRPHVQQMRENVATALGIPIERVSIKARSTDGIGPEGEGVVASADATVLLRCRETG